jgi:hypothetical protein
VDDANLIVIQTFGSQLAADLARTALESAGIEVMTAADSVGHMRDHIAWSTGGFKLLVREEDAEDARAVLEPLDQEHLL